MAALSVFVVAWGAAVIATTIAAVLYEMSLGGATPEEMAEGLLTPALFLANNLGVALAIPAALVAHRVVFGHAPDGCSRSRDGSGGGSWAPAFWWPLGCT